MTAANRPELTPTADDELMDHLGGLPSAAWEAVVRWAAPGMLRDRPDLLIEAVVRRAWGRAGTDPTTVYVAELIAGILCAAGLRLTADPA